MRMENFNWLILCKGGAEVVMFTYFIHIHKFQYSADVS
jgi:hypothetical protein